MRGSCVTEAFLWGVVRGMKCYIYGYRLLSGGSGEKGRIRWGGWGDNLGQIGFSMLSV